MKEFIVPPLKLALVCAICCGLLAGANQLTRDRITAAEAKAIDESLAELPNAGTFQEITDFFPENTEKATATALYLDENGQYAVLITADGYNKGGLQVIVGVDADNAITGFSFVSVTETPGLGTKVRDNPELLLTALTGLSDQTDIQQTDAITGATYSSNGMKSAAICALQTVSKNREVSVS